MRNPYRSQQMCRIRHKWRWLYLLVAPLRIPEYLLWRLEMGQLWLEHVISRTDWTRGPFAPVAGLIRFGRYWWSSRPFQKLLIALPVVLGFLALMTLYYININRSRGGAEEKYFMDATEALNRGNYKKADFLFARVIQYRRYEDDPTALFRGMIAAYANGNQLRFRDMKKLLVVEMNYEPAKGWYVDMMLNQAGEMNSKARNELLSICRDMVANSGKASWAPAWRVRMAQLYRRLGQPDDAMAVLEALDSPTVVERSVLNHLLFESGRSDEASLKVAAILGQIESEDPLRDRYLAQWIEAKLMQAILENQPRRAVARLQEALTEIAKQRARPDANLPQLDNWQSVLHIKMLLEYSKIGGQNEQVYRSAILAVSGTQVNFLIGSVINELADPYSSLSLRLEELEIAVAEYGGSVAHLAFALRLWDEGRIEQARRHFEVAASMQDRDRMIEVLHIATMDRERKAQQSQGEQVFFGGGDTEMDKIHKLLNEQILLDPSREVAVMIERARLYSRDRDWRAVVELLDPQVADWKPEHAATGYSFLIQATQQMSDISQVEEYRAKRDEIVNRLR